MATVYEPEAPRRDAPPRRLPPEVPRVLSALRTRVRRYLGWQTALLALSILGVAFWVGLAVDWYCEPPRAVRAAMLAGAAIVWSAAVGASLYRLVRAPLSPVNLALLLERRFPKLGESLLTLVDLAEQPGSRFAPELLEATTRRALRELSSLDLGRVFNPKPLRRWLGVAALLCGAVGVFAAAAPSAARIYASRALLLSDQGWPRATRLTLDGFRDGAARVARGADFDLRIEADAAGEVPPQIRLWYRSEGDAWLSVDLPLQAPAQGRGPRYEHTLTAVVDSLDLEVRGGDARIRDLRLEAVDPPQVSEVVLECGYPSYLGRGEQRMTLTTAGPLPEGTSVRAILKASKPLAEARWKRAESEAWRSESPGGRREFAIDLGALAAGSTAIDVELVDADEIHSPPWRLQLESVADRPPQVEAQPRGLGAAITPQAKIPWEGKARDEYGLAELAWATKGSASPKQAEDENAEGSVEEEIAHQSLGELAESPREAEVDAAFDVGPLNLKPGDTLQLAVAARDRWNLGPEPHIGYSQWIVRKVVEPDELRSDLEARELNLRRRVEKVSGDLDALADSLSRLDPAPAEAEARQAQRLQTERGLEDVRQARGELRSVAAALAELRDEGANNQVLGEEARSRLNEGVIEPLGRLADEQGGRLAQRLERLREEVAEAKPGAAEARAAAEAETAEARRQVQRILERMRQRETLHEVVELLRGILREQTEVNAATRQQRQKGLLEELGE